MAITETYPSIAKSQAQRSITVRYGRSVSGGWIIDYAPARRNIRRGYRQMRKAGLPAFRAKWIIQDLLSAGLFHAESV